MISEIFNNRQHDSLVWIEVRRGRKYITLRYRTIMQGESDVTVTYNLDDEAELMETLNTPACNIVALTEFGWGPVPVKTVVHEAVR